MSDFDPRHYDQYGNRTGMSDMNYDASGGRGPYILLAILVVIGVLGGVLYFNHSPRNSDQQAQSSPAATDTTKLPTAPALPAKPATPAMPGGAANPNEAPSGGGK